MHEVLDAFFKDPQSTARYGIKRVQAIGRVRDAAQIERSRNAFTRFFNAIREIDGEAERMEKYPSEPVKWRKFKSDFAKVGTVALVHHILGEEAEETWRQHGIPELDQPHEIHQMQAEELEPVIRKALTRLSDRHQVDKYHLLSVLWQQVKEGKAK